MSCASARQRLFARWSADASTGAATRRSTSRCRCSSARCATCRSARRTSRTMCCRGRVPELTIIRTTLDSRLQSLTERVLANYVRERSSTGIHNATALLVDYRDMSVRAMVGSADFDSIAIDGQVNGTLAKRSPGSALKPFIYALAIDQGLIHPLTVLKDAPTSFGPYSPENFDGRFVGPITATEALDALAQRAGCRAVRAAHAAESLRVPESRRRLAAGERAALRSRAHARRRRSDAGGDRDAVRDARESRPARAAALSRRRGSRARTAPAVGGSELHDARHAEERAAPGRCLRTASQQRAGRVEDRHVVGLPRCVDRGRVRPVRARRVGRQLRRLRQSGVRRRAGRRAAVLPHRRRDRRRAAGSSSPRFVSRRGWSASTSAAHRAICRTRSARRR